MADKKSELANKLAEATAQFEREIDELIENKKKNASAKDKKDVSDLTAEELENYLEECPLLMTKIPDNIEGNSALEALQALKYDDEDDTPAEKAEAFKEDGNFQYKSKKFRKAVKAYTEGIKVQCPDCKINAILYTNRSTSQLCLGNNRSALNDAKAARKLLPEYIKTYERGAKACCELKEFDDAIVWCDDGLSIDPENTKLQDIRITATSGRKTQERDRRKQELIRKKEKEAERIFTENLMQAFKDRNIRIEFPKNCEVDKNGAPTTESFLKALNPEHESGSMVHLDEKNCLNWPVLFLYPEYGQSDFIGAFNEQSRFFQHVQEMFESETAPWDVDEKYLPEDMEVYFEDRKTGVFYHLNSHMTLLDAISHERYTIRLGTPTFIILVKGSEFRDNYLKKIEVVKIL